MTERRSPGKDRISVVHCFRPLVGGVFRHVFDLAKGQAERGLDVGIICDASNGNERAEAALAELAPHCGMGIHRLPIRRRLHVSDFGTQRAITQVCTRLRPDIVHGHGAKGGAFARLLPSRLGARVVYTPHGGVLHYDKGSLAGRYYFALERYLRRSTDGLIFASRFGASQYEEKIGAMPPVWDVIHNGLHEEDFAPIPPASQDHDFVFAGELRKLKGLDTLLEATAQIVERRAAKLMVFGAGPDAAFFDARVRELGLDTVVTVHPPVFPISAAFARGRVVVVPSHAESFPYIVLEAIAAGMPLITTRAGGIPEIFGEYADRLVPPGDVGALVAAMDAALDGPEDARRVSQTLAERVREHFSVASMVDASLAHYRRVLGQA